MSKLKEQYLEQYSFSTLRDAALTSLANGDFIVYNSSTLKWENKKQPRFGTDFAEITKEDSQPFTGGAWQNYMSLTFTVSGPDLLNKYRCSISFLWRHSSVSNDAMFRMLIDGNQAGDVIQIEPKDNHEDQKANEVFVWYPSNLSIGSHTLVLQCKPSTTSQTTTIEQGVAEVWRVQ